MKRRRQRRDPWARWEETLDRYIAEAVAEFARAADEADEQARRRPEERR